MSGTITWLHISDTHFCNKKNGWDSEEIIGSFYEDLKIMKSEYNLYPDLMFFTGDIALGHFNDSCGLSLRDQYKEANEFLERILEIFPQISISNIFIVPGNHDVNRTLVGEGQTKWLKSLLKNSQEIGRRRINELITENNVDWKRCMERLNDYRDFLRNNGYQHLLQDPDRLTYSIICDINGFKVGIAGLNSAWSSYGGDEDKANLLLGTYQISEARNKLKDTMLSIAIVHHPPNWFTNFEDPKINREIERNFSFHLHGHEHQDWVMPIEKHIRIAAGALYNSSEQKNGYNFVRLYPSENRGEVFLRTYNNGVWIPNIIGNKTTNEGIWNLDSSNINIRKNENIIGDGSNVGVPKLAEESSSERTTVLDEKKQENDFSSKIPTAAKDSGSSTLQILPPPPVKGSTNIISNVPYSRNPRFTGREDKLKQIHDALISGNTVAVSQPIAVCGLGGIGKTQTAVEYTYLYRAEYEFIFWVKADSEDSIISGYVDIAKLLNLPVKNDSDQNNIVSAVLNWFRTHEKWLLALDNADDTSFIKNYLPPDPKGHILLTSRAQVFDALEITELVKMEEMSPDEAKSFLLKRTGREDLHQSEFEALEKLVHELGYLPLALEQAGAYIYANNSSFKDYLVSYNKRGLKLLEKSPIEKNKYPESISTTWLMNFEEVKKKSEVSADVLFASAFLNPHEIPAEIFYKGAEELGPLISAEFDEVDIDPLVFDEVLKPLWQYSLINRETGCRNYDIHRLVQAVLRDGMEKSEQKLWAERVVKAVNRAFPEVEYKNWELCDKLLPHAQTCAEYIGLWDLETEESAKLLNATGSYLHKRARFKESESLLKSSLEIRKKVLQSEHFDLSESFNNLGELYLNLGRYSEAEPLFLRALEIRENTANSDHPAIAESLNNLAQLYRIFGRYSETEPLNVRALKIRETVLKLDDPALAESLDNLAGVYRDLGKYSEAEPLYIRALEITEKSLGPEHPDVGIYLNNLASVYRSLCRYSEAESLFIRALGITEKALGPEHPTVGTCLNNLASVYSDLGRYSEAESLCIRALEITEKALGPEHPDVGNRLNSLAGAYEVLGKYSEAKHLYIRALGITEKALGPVHPTVGIRLNNLASVYRSLCKYSEAEPLFIRALEITEKALGPEHPDVGIYLNNLASFFTNQKKYLKAKPYYERAIEVTEKNKGENSVEVASLLEHYASLLNNMKKNREATRISNRAKRIRSTIEKGTNK